MSEREREREGVSDISIVVYSRFMSFAVQRKRARQNHKLGGESRGRGWGRGWGWGGVRVTVTFKEQKQQDDTALSFVTNVTIMLSSAKVKLSVCFHDLRMLSGQYFTSSWKVYERYVTTKILCILQNVHCYSS